MGTPGERTTISAFLIKFSGEERAETQPFSVRYFIVFSILGAPSS